MVTSCPFLFSFPLSLTKGFTRIKIANVCVCVCVHTSSMFFLLPNIEDEHVSVPLFHKPFAVGQFSTEQITFVYESFSRSLSLSRLPLFPPVYLCVVPKFQNDRSRKMKTTYFVCPSQKATKNENERENPNFIGEKVAIFCQFLILSPDDIIPFHLNHR